MRKIGLMLLVLLFSLNVLAQGGIDFLLYKKNPIVFGPNCWNSVLYAKGFTPGVYYSDGELPFWLNSPICRIVQARKSGDIVDIANLSDSKKDYNSLHSYIYLGEVNGFTKNGPDLEEPYQISTHSDINNYYELTDSNCLNITPEEGLKRKCEIISTAYRCEDITSLISFLGNSENYKKLSVVAQQITSSVFSTQDMTLININDLKEIRITAIKEISLPTFDSLPFNLQSIIKRHFGLNARSRHNTQQFRDYITEIVYLNAHPDQRLQVKNSPQSKLIEEFRSGLNYTRMPSKDFYYWAHILNTTRNMLSQIEELSKL